MLRFTPWKLAGTAGATASVGTPVLQVRATASYLYMPLKNPTTGKTLIIHAVGLGVGVGVSARPSPVHLKGRVPQFPSNQFGTLVFRPKQRIPNVRI